MHVRCTAAEIVLCRSSLGVEDHTDSVYKHDPIDFAVQSADFVQLAGERRRCIHSCSRVGIPPYVVVNQPTNPEKGTTPVQSDDGT
jgi:hypothetical protein